MTRATLSTPRHLALLLLLCVTAASLQPVRANTWFDNVAQGVSDRIHAFGGSLANAFHSARHDANIYDVRTLTYRLDDLATQLYNPAPQLLAMIDAVRDRLTAARQLQDEKRAGVARALEQAAHDLNRIAGMVDASRTSFRDLASDTLSLASLAARQASRITMFLATLVTCGVGIMVALVYGHDIGEAAALLAAGGTTALVATHLLIGPLPVSDSLAGVFASLPVIVCL